MNTAPLKSYAPAARRAFIQAVTDRAARYGLTPKKIEPVTIQGDVAIITGEAFTEAVSRAMRVSLRLGEPATKKKGLEDPSRSGSPRSSPPLAGSRAQSAGFFTRQLRLKATRA